MLNCPGEKPLSATGPPAGGSSAMVIVSCVSRDMRSTRYGTGTIGSGAGAGAAGRALDTRAVDVEDLETGRPQALPEHPGEPLQQLIAEAGILLALPADARAVELRRADGLERPRVAGHAVGRDQPRPPHDVAGADGQHRERPAFRRGDLERHPSVAEQIEVIG